MGGMQSGTGGQGQVWNQKLTMPGPGTPGQGGKPGGQGVGAPPMGGGGMGTKPGGSIPGQQNALFDLASRGNQYGGPATPPSYMQLQAHQNAPNPNDPNAGINPVPAWYQGGDRTQQFRGADHPSGTIGRGLSQSGRRTIRNVSRPALPAQGAPPPAKNTQTAAS